MKLLLVCLRYTPGNWQHISAFARAANERGDKARLFLSARFRWMNSPALEGDAWYPTISDTVGSMLKDITAFFLWKWPRYAFMLRRERPDHMLFVMWHPLNLCLAVLVRLVSPSTTLSAWVHEPYKADKSEYRSLALYLVVIEFLQGLLFRFLDVVVLHSARASQAFRTRFPAYKGQAKTIPLLFQDKSGTPPSLKERSVDLVFIGRATVPKGADTFFSFVEESAREKYGYRFHIITHSDISAWEDTLSPEAKNVLMVTRRSNISDEEIVEAARESVAAFAPYKETTQSGVIPVALMCGTPVIGTDIEGIQEYIVGGKNGVLLAPPLTHQAIREALERVKRDFSSLSEQARVSYLERYDIKNAARYYNWMFETEPP